MPNNRGGGGRGGGVAEDHRRVLRGRAEVPRQDLAVVAGGRAEEKVPDREVPAGGGEGLDRLVRLVVEDFACY